MSNHVTSGLSIWEKDSIWLIVWYKSRLLAPGHCPTKLHQTHSSMGFMCNPIFTDTTTGFCSCTFTPFNFAHDSMYGRIQVPRKQYYGSAQHFCPYLNKCIFLPLLLLSSKNHAFIRRHDIDSGDYEKWPHRSSSPFNLNATVPTNHCCASQWLTKYTLQHKQNIEPHVGPLYC